MSAQAIARRLVEREVNGESDTEALRAAMQRAAGRVVEDLNAAVGADGLEALLVRAIARTQREHPAAASMWRTDGADNGLDVGAAIDAHGAEAARTALEAVLAGLVDILAALIGADMTRNLLHDDDS